MKILVIDDDRESLKHFGDLLNVHGHAVSQLSDPCDAVALYRSEKFEVVITDFKMPGMNGIEVLKAVKAHNPEAYVIILTGYADVNNTIPALNNGAFAFFTKPLNTEKLLNTLQEIEAELCSRGETRGQLREVEKTHKELNQTYQELQNHVVAVDQMQSISRNIHATIDIRKILEELVGNTAHLLDCEFCLIIYKDESSGQYDCRSNREQVQNKICGCNTDSGLLETYPFKLSVSEGKSLLNNDPPPELKRAFEEKGVLLNNYLSVPLVQGGRSQGILIGFNKETGFSSNDKFMLNAIGATSITAISNSGLISQLREFSEKTVESLAKAIDARDKYTHGHTERVSEYTLAICRSLDWKREKLNQAFMGTLLHDIGKIGIPDAVLNKPGRLTEQEYELMKSHPDIGLEILKDIPRMKEMLNYVHCHHECYDGSGYPQGLKGEDIPLEGRIVCVADAFDAMTSDRSYRKALSVEEAMAELERCSGSQFDPRIVNVFQAITEREAFGGGLQECSQIVREEFEQVSLNISS